MKYAARQFFFILPAIVLALSVGAFAQSGLVEGKWRLTEANGRAVTNSSAFIDFEPGLDKFTGNTGCNGLTGTVEVRGAAINMKTIATTKRMCKLMAGNVAEGEFLNALGAATRFSSTRNTLTLYDRRGRRILRFSKIADDVPAGGATKLAGRKWSLESVKGRQTFAPIVGAYIRFDEKGRTVNGSSGCNSFGGKYRLPRRGAIALTGIITTMKACLEGDKMSVQSDLFDGIGRASRYEIREGRLYLYRGNQLELTFREDND